MWQLNVLLSCLNRPDERFIPLLTDNIAERSLCVLFISFSSSHSSFVFLGILISWSLSPSTLITSSYFCLCFHCSATTQPPLLRKSFCYLPSKSWGQCVTWLEYEIIASLLFTAYMCMLTLGSWRILCPQTISSNKNILLPPLVLHNSQDVVNIGSCLSNVHKCLCQFMELWLPTSLTCWHWLEQFSHSSTDFFWQRKLAWTSCHVLTRSMLLLDGPDELTRCVVGTLLTTN